MCSMNGAYDLKVISQGPACAVRLDGPADPTTGLQYSREIALPSNSTQISFHAVMRNMPLDIGFDGPCNL